MTISGLHKGQPRHYGAGRVVANKEAPAWTSS
jgi:hypothetical protein